MKTKPIPAIIMLLAGFVTCIMSIYQGLDLKTFTITLFIVLLVFYVMGCIIKYIIDRNFEGMADPVEEEQENEEGEFAEDMEEYEGYSEEDMSDEHEANAFEDE